MRISAIAELVLSSRYQGWAGRLTAAIRVATGGIFVGFGGGKFTQHAHEAESFDRYGLPFADQLTYAIGVVEVGAGILLLLGLLTRLAALALAGDMVGAIATAGPVDGGVVHLVVAPLLLVAMLFLIWAGSGRTALDRRLLSRLGTTPAKAPRAPAPASGAGA